MVAGEQRSRSAASLIVRTSGAGEGKRTGSRLGMSHLRMIGLSATEGVGLHLAVAPPLSQVTWPLKRNPPPWGGDNVARQRRRCDSASPPALHAARSRLESLLASRRISRPVPEPR